MKTDSSSETPGARAPAKQLSIDDAVKSLGLYVYRIHKAARKNISNLAAGKAARATVNTSDSPGDPSTTWDVKMTGGKGNKKPELYQAVNKDHSENPMYARYLDEYSKDFELDSVQVKADLNLLAAAAGQLRRAIGGGARADATYLEKVPRYMKAPEVVARQPDVQLKGQFKDLGGEALPPQSSSKKDDDKQKGPPSAQGPKVRRRKSPTVMLPMELPPDYDPSKNESVSFGRYFDMLIERAAAGL